MKFKKYLSESIADAEEGIIDVLGNSEKTKDEVYKIIKRKYGLKRYEFNDAWKDMVKDGDISKVGGNKYTVESTMNERTQKQRELFVLGRQVQDELNKVMITMTLRPKASDFDKVAKVLGISKSKAIKAFNEFTWGE